jgi:flagellar biosynthesis protein FlhG
MKDQALKLREIASERKSIQGGMVPNLVGVEPAGPRTIAVTSGKGGVGKTSLSINLGLALAAQGKRVILLDADLGLANINVALGLRARYTLQDVLTGQRSIEQILVEGPGGVQIIPGASGIAELANITDSQRERLIGSFSKLARHADVMVIDTSAGLSKNVVSFALLADVVIVVTVPEPPAIADAYGMIKALMQTNPGIDIKLVVNRILSSYEGQAVQDKIGLVVRRFLNGNIDPIGCLRENQLVGDAVRAQKPLFLEHPTSPVAQDVRHLASRLFPEEGRDPGVMKGFIDRLKRWFA